MNLNILICGIGGQGVVYLGSFLRNHFLSKYPDFIIIGTESRGVSQREGSVSATVRIQREEKPQIIYSPELPNYSADIVFALEPLELLRNFQLIQRNSIIILNNEPIIPKSSVRWLLDKSSNSTVTNTKIHSNPKWVTNKVVNLMNRIPKGLNRKKIPLVPPNKSITKSNLKIKSYSTSPNILDMNFSTLITKELEDSSSLNLVMLGFFATISKSLLEINHVKELITTQRNLLALEFGVKLASMYPDFENTH